MSENQRTLIVWQSEESSFATPILHYQSSDSYLKSAHTALAVKACLLGCEQTATLKCSTTFVNIAVAISALARGGGPLKKLRTEPGIKWSLRDFSAIFGWRTLRGHGTGTWARFGKVPSPKKTTNMKKLSKLRCFQGFWKVIGIENATKNKKQKNSVLDRFYAQKRINYVVFERQH